jgi:hypothetical protein
MPTKDELEAENADLRQRIDELETAAAEAPPAAADAAAAPRYPVDGDGNRQLSAGEADDLRQYGVTVSPFDGAKLNALDEGIEPGNPEAAKRAEQAQRPAEVVPNEWPIAGPPPAEGGDSDPDHLSARTGN